MGRVGALAGAGLEQAAGLAGLEHRVQEEPFGPAGRQAAAELGEDGEVEAGVVELEAEGVLPVDAAADGIGGPSIGEVLGELHDGDQGEPPGRQRGLPAPGVEVGEVAVAEDVPELVAEPEVGIPLGEGGAGDAGGQFGDGRDGARLQRHGSTSGCGQRIWCKLLQYTGLPPRREFANSIHCYSHPSSCSNWARALPSWVASSGSRSTASISSSTWCSTIA